jgi:two-component system LytT family response regulator
MSGDRILIVDDEPLALRRLEIVLKGLSGVRLVGSAASCREAVLAIVELRPDIVLLDIRLRDGTGFDVLEQLPPDLTPAVIFTTAFDHFAIRAFEVSAVDYVLKPIETARLQEAIKRARERLSADDSSREIEEMRRIIVDLRAEFHAGGPSPYETELWIRGVSGNLTHVALDQVDWVSSEDDYVRLHTPSGSHLLRLSIKALSERIDSAKFVRVHRAALVRVAAITQIRQTPTGRRDVILRDGTRIATGRVYARRLREMLREHA